MTDSSGNEINNYDYDPYGNLLDSHVQSGINNPWMYADGYYDSNSGLCKYGIPNTTPPRDAGPSAHPSMAASRRR